MKLTLLGKIFLATVILATVGFIAWRNSAGHWRRTTPARPELRRIVVGVNDFGGAYAGLVANDGARPGPGSRFAAAGLDVEFRLIRDSRERLAAFERGDVDVVLLTLDYFANVVPEYRQKGVELQSFLLVDWSRGNLGIITRGDRRSVESLADAKIATTRNTPTHYFLLSLLARSNLQADPLLRLQSNLVFAPRTDLAADMFKRGEVDAVVTWEPYLSRALAGGDGQLLVSTRTATHLVPDVLFARADFLDLRRQDMVAFTRIWLEGVEVLRTDPDGAVAIISRAFQQPREETRSVLSKIKPAAFADNRSFFGLDGVHVPYLSLFDDASRVWKREGVIAETAPAARTRWLHALLSLAPEYAGQKVVEDFQFDPGAMTGAPLLTRSVSVYFPSGSDALDANSRRLVDEFSETLATFGNAYVRVEGNTDNSGPLQLNIDLSKRRALALVDYLVKQHGFDRKRFVAVGNGPNKPIGDNGTAQGREANRRTDFQIIPNP